MNHEKIPTNNLKIFYLKYLKYKNKYLTLKNITGGTINKDEIIFDGDFIVQKIISKSNKKIGEASRFNTKTKEVKHWYATQICSNILDNISDVNSPINILVLGVALGGIPIHLLHRLPSARVTGVDITGQYYEIIRNYAETDRLELIEADANEFVKNPEPKYDIIISDIFDDITMPDFVLSEDFLSNILAKLNPKGKFLLNSIGVSENKLQEILNKIFPNSDIKIIDRPGLSLSNTISICQLK